MVRPGLSVALAAILLAAEAAAQTPEAEAPGFRIRSEFGAPLNADRGWAAPDNTPATLEADRPFRLRVLARSAGRDAGVNRYRLQYRRNQGAWVDVEAHDFPLPERTVEFDFTRAAPGARPLGWSGGLDLELIETAGGGAFLRARAGGLDRAAFIEPPWPLEAFVLGAEFRLPSGQGERFELVFGDHRASASMGVRFDGPAREVRVVSVSNGEETIITRRAFEFPADAWINTEIERIEDRLRVDLLDGALTFDLTMPDPPAPGRAGFRLGAPGMIELRGFTLEGEPRTPRVSLVSGGAFTHGDTTLPLLRPAGASEPGYGVSLQAWTPAWAAPPGALGEFEWPLVIRRFSDGAEVNEDGDVFRFRMVDADGQVANAGPDPAVTLRVPAGHLGGTFVETPGRIGPFQASGGDLYFIIEPAETDNLFMMMKSQDGGRSWREIDGPNRPATGDLEAVDARLVGDTIHITHQITEAVLHHAFATSDHPALPDRWLARDEPVASGDAISQMASLAVRSDGGQVIVYLDDTLRYVRRTPQGGVSPARLLDPDAHGITAGPQAVRGAADAVHIAYFEADGALWHRRLNGDMSSSPRQLIAEGAGATEAEYGAVLPLVYLQETRTLVIAYRLADGTLWERRIVGDAPPTPPVRLSARRVITNAVDSQQPAADLVSDGADLHALFVDAGTRDIYLTSDCGRGWTAPSRQVAAIDGSWVRGGVYARADGVRVYGFVYDAGSRGGAGMNRFGEIVLDDLAGCR